MRFGGKRAVGIDIGEDRISMAVLRITGKGVELVKSAAAPVPAGAVKDGSIEDATAIGQAIRELRVRSKVRADRAAVSLFGKSVVVQIVDMPKQVPSNVRQYVHSEVKHYVVLPGQDIVLDFCSTGSGKRTSDKRVLAAAADSGRMLKLVDAVGRAGFRVEAIEPGLLSYVRGIDAGKIAAAKGGNMLIALLRGKVLTLCVLRNKSIDFVRTKEFGGDLAETSDLGSWLAEEIAEIERFYKIEVSDSPQKWEATVFVDVGDRDIGSELLKSGAAGGKPEVRTREDAYLDSPVREQAKAEGEHPSPVAVGLAMKLLSLGQDSAAINLLPPQIVTAREAKRDVLIAANVIAATALAMLVAIMAFALMIERTTRNITAKEQIVKNQDTSLMVERHREIRGRLESLSARLDRVAQIGATHPVVNWADVLEEVRKATPGSVRINRVFSADGARMQIEGVAISNDAVNSFVGYLGKSRAIGSVTLLEARRQEGQNEYIAYQISCKLVVRKDKAKNVG